MALFGWLHFYLGRSLVEDLGLTSPWEALLWSGVWGGMVAVVGGAVGGRLFPRSTARLFQWLGFGWLGVFGLLVVAFAATDAVLWVAEHFTPVDGSARFVRAASVSSMVVLAAAWGFFVARRPTVKRLDVQLPGLPRALDGFRVVQLSDVHIGETLGRPFAELLTRDVNALQADVVVITGDLVDGSVERLRDEVAPFAGLQATHGVYFVTGNHEYYHGGDVWESACADLGMTVLRNQHRVVEHQGAKLVIGGVPDVEASKFAVSHAPSADLAFAGAPDGVTRLLLAHQPRFAKSAAGHGVSLMLSGHTHAGQIFPFMLFVRLQQPVIAGLEVLSGVLTYTSAGTGYWGPPYRIGTRGEVTEITLRAAPASPAE
jgi:predicted MPP superfamily phosphohydrolase